MTNCTSKTHPPPSCSQLLLSLPSFLPSFLLLSTKRTQVINQEQRAGGLQGPGAHYVPHNGLEAWTCCEQLMALEILDLACCSMSLREPGRRQALEAPCQPGRNQWGGGREGREREEQGGVVNAPYIRQGMNNNTTGIFRGNCEAQICFIGTEIWAYNTQYTQKSTLT